MQMEAHLKELTLQTTEAASLATQSPLAQKQMLDLLSFSAGGAAGSTELSPGSLALLLVLTQISAPSPCSYSLHTSAPMPSNSRWEWTLVCRGAGEQGQRAAGTTAAAPGRQPGDSGPPNRRRSAEQRGAWWAPQRHGGPHNGQGSQRQHHSRCFKRQGGWPPLCRPLSQQA